MARRLTRRSGTRLSSDHRAEIISAAVACWGGSAGSDAIPVLIHPGTSPLRVAAPFCDRDAALFDVLGTGLHPRLLAGEDVDASWIEAHWAPRGTPSDVSPEAALFLTEDAGGHSATWFSRAELQRVDWSRAGVTSPAWGDTLQRLAALVPDGGGVDDVRVLVCFC